MYAYVGNSPVGCVDPWGAERALADAGTWSSYWGQIGPAVTGFGSDLYARLPSRQSVQTFLDHTQTTLDYAGLVAQGPFEVAGPFIDVAGAGVSLLRGDYTGASLSAVSAFPIIGSAANVAKVARGVENAAEAAQGEVTVYRVFGGDARAQGFSWTTTDPRTVSNFRDAAGLPSGGPSGGTNTADFLVKGQANAADIITSRSALPLDGNKGGLPELIIDPKNVKITDFSVLKP